jgi:hypothetical protein
LFALLLVLLWRVIFDFFFPLARSVIRLRPQDLEVTGTIDLEPDSFIREEAAKSKPKKYMLSVGTAKRVFMMFAETPVRRKTKSSLARIRLLTCARRRPRRRRRNRKTGLPH